MKLHTQPIRGYGKRYDSRKFLNLFTASERIPDKVEGYYVSLERLLDKKKEDRYTIIQKLVSDLNSKGIDCAAAPESLEKYSLVLLNPPPEKIGIVSRILEKYGPDMEITTISDIKVIEKAWKNRVRSHLIARGYLRIGNHYITKREIKSTSKYKKAFRVQALIHYGRPALYIDLRTKIMEPLSDNLINLAEEDWDDSEIRVRVLPNWYEGFLVGREGRRAGDVSFPFGDKEYRGDEYWKVKHGIDFVTPEDELLRVHVPVYGKTMSYPRSCVFLEFKSGTSLPEDIRKEPAQRVQESEEFLKQIQLINFLGLQYSFSITSASEAGFVEYSFTPKVNVMIGNGKEVTVNNASRELKNHGPFSGPVNGKYVVIYPDTVDLGDLMKAMSRIEKVYSELKLGDLKTADLNNGYFCAEECSDRAYVEVINEIKMQLRNPDILALVMLPEEHPTEIYYKSRKKLFESYLDLKPIKAQCLRSETVNKILNDENFYYICANIASQCYVKLGGSGSAVWILSEPADSPIRGVEAGSSCYAYYDVSRRPRKKHRHQLTARSRIPMADLSQQVPNLLVERG